MKKAALLVFMVLSHTLCLGQQVEYTIQANSGLFYFGGESATRTSDLILGSGRRDINYTNNPYGKIPGWSYGLAAQAQKVTAKNIIWGLQGSYEILRNQVKLKHAYTLVSSATAPAVTGETVLSHHFINAHPFAGKRFTLAPFVLDLAAGLDLAYNVSSHEKGKATDTNGHTYTSDRDRDKAGLDTRARLNLTAYYHHFGLTTGYSYGFKNYTPTTEGADRENFARFFRLGLVYKI